MAAIYTYSINYVGVVLLMLLLLQARSGNLAPTHHLRISVQGNTPRLIVTSAEVGITPAILATKATTTTSTTAITNTDGIEESMTTSTATSTMTTSTTMSPKWLQKGNQLKLKNKSLKAQYDKKRAEKATKEKGLMWHGKNSTPAAETATTTAASSVVIPHDTTTETAAAAAIMKVMKPPKTQTTTATTTTTGKSVDFATELNSETSTATFATSTAATTVVTREQQAATTTTTITTSDSTSPGNLPHQIQTSSLAPVRQVSPTTGSSGETTPAPLVDTASIKTSDKDSVGAGEDVSNKQEEVYGIEDAKMKALPKAPSPKLRKNDEGKSQTAMKTASTLAVELTPAATPVITTEAAGNAGSTSATTASGGIMSTTTTAPLKSTVFDTKSNSSDDAGDSIATTITTVSQETIITPTVTPILATTAQVNIKESNPAEESTVSAATTTTTTTMSGDIRSSTIASVNAALVPMPASMATMMLHSDKRVEPELEQDAVIKLIDLEKHEPISIDELRMKERSHLVESDGHDGVKQTKKKQLLDKHFAVDTLDTMQQPVAADFDIVHQAPATAVSTTKAAAIHDMNDDVAATQEEKPALMTPTLMPAHHAGYLGPIVMEEHTYSVVHKAAKKPHEHEASIETKLHDGRIVEIIAPTALVEPSVTTGSSITAPRMQTTTNVPPISVMKPAADVMQQATALLSTTIFQVAEQPQSTTHQPSNPVVANQNEQRESKISDIQIEVYDNIAAAADFMGDDSQSQLRTTKPPSLLPTTQERFTQYVVDRTESSTPDTALNTKLNFHGIGKPEPAAIEIHINVSEGLGAASEDLEFAYHQLENVDETKPIDDLDNASTLTSRPLVSASATQPEANVERGDDILVVEIIDTGDNSTELQSASAESMKPVFTFRTDSDADIELKDIKFASNADEVRTDELFMADLQQGGDSHYAKPPILPPPPPPRTSTVDRDSDTIFYISNTEVKVGESPPGPITESHDEQLRRTRLENQFFPANYVASTHPNTAALGLQQQQKQKQLQPQHPKHLYEEDIILSPLRNTADSLKIFRDGAPPLDVTYVGESVIEVEQSSGAGMGVTTTPAAVLPITTNMAPSQTPDVIIQPAILPEMSIGVPVIGELPPQIELKEIDFMPNEANQRSSGVYENENNDIEAEEEQEESLNDGVANSGSNNNDVERIVESSIQYGGDLIDEGAGGGGGFDGVEGSYPFGNVATMRRKPKNGDAADYAHFTLQHSVSNLRKDELSVDVVASPGTGETLEGIAAGGDNTTTMLLQRNGNESLTAAMMNISYIVAERIGGNATAFSIVDEPNANVTDEEAAFRSLFTWLIGIALVLLPILVIGSIACAMRYLYNKLVPPSSIDNSENSEDQLPNGTILGRDRDGASGGDESTQPTSPTNADIREEKTEKDCLKPSNNINSLNIVDERRAAENFVNRSTKSCALRKNAQQPDGQLNSVQDSYAGPNGSVTKMTLKNNHLIVETEERNDISRDARETKMHYNTSDKDGVFVVEVARGIDSKIISESTISEVNEERLSIVPNKLNGSTARSPTRKFEDEPAVHSNHEQVQIHQPPTELHNSNTERSLHQIDEVEEESTLSPKADSKVEIIVEANLVKNANTGLSQSDLSSTSSADSNKRYSYGNQELYTIEQAGYATSSPTAASTGSSTRPAVESQDDDRKSENGHSLEHSPKQVNCTEEVNGANDDDDGKVNTENISVEEIHAKTNGEAKTSEELGDAELKLKEIIQHEEVIAQTESPNCNSNDTMKVREPIQLEELNGSLVDVDTMPAKEDDNMSVSEQEIVVESMTTDTDSTQKLAMDTIEQTEALTSNSNQLDTQVEFESLPQAETDPEFNYDSLMSLPDPPSNEEMTQLSDFSAIETTQLDSLPPPPPPLTAAAATADENTNMPDIVAELKSKPMSVMNGNAEHYNGQHQQQQQSQNLHHHHQRHQPNNNDNQNHNGHEASEQNATLPLPLPPPLLEEINSNGGKLLPNSPLTPPESPPPSPPIQYSNGVGGINENLCAPNVHAVAVDVNGS